MYPHERSLVEEMKGKPFVILGVNSDRDKDKLKARIAEEKITWRSFWNGPKGTGGPISQDWNVSGWPTVYVIDHLGQIRHKSHGSPELDKIIQECVTAAEQAAKSDKTEKATGK